MIPLKTIEELIKKHSSLEKDLSSGKIDKNFFAVKSKEYADLNEVIQDAKKYFSYEKERLEIQKILDDKNSDSELLKMAEVELNDLKLENENNEKRLKLFLLPKDEADKKDAITVSYTHLRAHETSLHLVCRLLLEKKVIQLKKN